MNAIGQPFFSRRGHSREVYSVEGTRVVLNERGDWRCESRTCNPGYPCTHVGQAQRFRQMRGTKPPDPTAELQFLDGEPDTAARSDTPAVVVVRRPSPWVTVLAAAGIAGLSSGITYVTATSRTENVPTTTQPRYVTAAPVPVMPEPEPASPPVRIVNVFDPAEVFEFPAGTSESEARKAAAEFLLERARHRLASR